MIWLKFLKSHLIFIKLLHMNILLNELTIVEMHRTEDKSSKVHCISTHVLELFHILEHYNLKLKWTVGTDTAQLKIGKGPCDIFLIFICPV